MGSLRETLVYLLIFVVSSTAGLASEPTVLAGYIRDYPEVTHRSDLSRIRILLETGRKEEILGSLTITCKMTDQTIRIGALLYQSKIQLTDTVLMLQLPNTASRLPTPFMGLLTNRPRPGLGRIMVDELAVVGVISRETVKTALHKHVLKTLDSGHRIGLEFKGRNRRKVILELTATVDPRMDNGTRFATRVTEQVDAIFTRCKS